MTLIKRLFLCIFTLQALFSCNLEKEIEIDVPAFENGYVVESYLSPGNNFGMLITKSYGFFEVFDSNQLNQEQLPDLLIQGANGYLEVDGIRHPLLNQIQIIPGTTTIYNYVLKDKVNFNENDRVKLVLTFPTGEEVEATTQIPERRPLDSIRLDTNKDMEVREVSFISTDSTNTEYFRRQLLRIRDNRIRIVQDYIVDNSTIKGRKLAFGSGYEFEIGDTLISRVSHIRKEYYDFYQSVTGSISANSNPFGQPGTISSNIRGSNRIIGIFTGINQSEIFRKIGE